MSVVPAGPRRRVAALEAEVARLRGREVDLAIELGELRVRVQAVETIGAAVRDLRLDVAEAVEHADWIADRLAALDRALAAHAGDNSRHTGKAK